LRLEKDRPAGRPVSGEEEDEEEASRAPARYTASGQINTSTRYTRSSQSPTQTAEVTATSEFYMPTSLGKMRGNHACTRVVPLPWPWPFLLRLRFHAVTLSSLICCAYLIILIPLLLIPACYVPAGKYYFLKKETYLHLL
jgi:hypothetical protein